MKNGFYLFMGCVVGVGLAISGNYVLAQFIGDTKLDISKPTLSEAKFASSTFESLDTYTKVKEEYENTQEITKRLDIIIDILKRK